MKNRKINAKDTIKKLPDDPKKAVKDDYEQTKANMKNIKDSAEDTITEKKNEWDRE